MPDSILKDELVSAETQIKEASMVKAKVMAECEKTDDSVAVRDTHFTRILHDPAPRLLSLAAISTPLRTHELFYAISGLTILSPLFNFSPFAETGRLRQ